MMVGRVLAHYMEESLEQYRELLLEGYLQKGFGKDMGNLYMQGLDAVMDTEVQALGEYLLEAQE